MYRVPPGVPTLIQHNFIWWIWPSWLRRQIVALKIVGSSPIIHPTKEKHPLAGAFLLWNPVHNWTRKGVKKQSGGLFLARGRVPLSTPYDNRSESNFRAVFHRFLYTLSVNSEYTWLKS